MKKKIAVFANGWSTGNLYQFLMGLKDNSPKDSVDYFVFLEHATYSMSRGQRLSECTVYSLPDLSDFDGAIAFTIGMNFIESIDAVFLKCKEAGIPTISIGVKHEGFYYVGVDNISGMTDLCDHMFEEHNVKSVKFIAGSREHPDSTARLKALVESAARHNVVMNVEDIFFSDWETTAASEYAVRLFADGKLPDAFICANDPLAEAINLELGLHGVYAPKDYLITGFDFLKESQLFYPSIASVDQHFDNLGREAASIFNDIFAGKETDYEHIISCEFIPGESCGCVNYRNEDGLRKEYTRTLPVKTTFDERVNGRIYAMEKAILSSEKYSTLAPKLQNLFYATDGREGDTFYILMDSKVSDISWDDFNNFTKHQFAEELDVIVAKYKSIPVSARSIRTKDLIPEYIGAGENSFYIFLSMYLESYVCGYMVFKDHLEYIEDRIFNKFENHINECLTSYKQNLKLNALNAKLSELMQKDPLTNVRNRIAYEDFKNTLEERFSLGDRSPFAVAMFDVNNLKKINDELGHESGDIYIKNSCKLICDSFKHSPVFRIGGDEFVAIVSNSDYEDRELLLEKMRSRMREIEGLGIPMVNRVSIASGMATFDEGIDNNLMDTFRRADELMYENKFLMKNGNIR